MKIKIDRVKDGVKVEVGNDVKVFENHEIRSLIQILELALNAKSFSFIFETSEK